MAQNYIQPGTTVPYVVPSATTIAAGDVVVMNDVLGVALTAGTTGDEITVQIEGVFTLDKTTGTAHNQGDVLYWNASTKKTTKTPTGNKPIGFDFLGALSGAATSQVKLAPLARLGAFA
jgi:predicted RecA/RadA family phage recombinase